MHAPNGFPPSDVDLMSSSIMTSVAGFSIDEIVSYAYGLDPSNARAIERVMSKHAGLRLLVGKLKAEAPSGSNERDDLVWEIDRAAISGIEELRRLLSRTDRPAWYIERVRRSIRRAEARNVAQQATILNFERAKARNRNLKLAFAAAAAVSIISFAGYALREGDHGTPSMAALQAPPPTAWAPPRSPQPNTAHPNTVVAAKPTTPGLRSRARVRGTDSSAFAPGKGAAVLPPEVRPALEGLAVVQGKADWLKTITSRGPLDLAPNRTIVTTRTPELQWKVQPGDGPAQVQILRIDASKPIVESPESAAGTYRVVGPLDQGAIYRWTVTLSRGGKTLMDQGAFYVASESAEAVAAGRAEGFRRIVGSIELGRLKEAQAAADRGIRQLTERERQLFDRYLSPILKP